MALLDLGGFSSATSEQGQASANVTYGGNITMSPYPAGAGLGAGIGQYLLPGAIIVAAALLLLRKG